MKTGQKPEEVVIDTQVVTDKGVKTMSMEELADFQRDLDAEKERTAKHLGLKVVTEAPKSLSTTEVKLTITQALEQYQLLSDTIDHLMVDGEHYGKSFPGDKKKCLLKPGADVLCVAFHLVAEYTIDERNYDWNHREYRVDCVIKSKDTGAVVAHGVGTCTTLESKYRYRNESQKCPVCGNAAIIKGKEEWGGGWLCYKKKGGCGLKFPDGDQSIEGQKVGKIENPDIADAWNTVLKIGKKRAYVDGTIAATGASPKFSQDADDGGGMNPPPPQQNNQGNQGGQSSPPAHQQNQQDQGTGRNQGGTVMGNPNADQSFAKSFYESLVSTLENAAHSDVLNQVADDILRNKDKLLPEQIEELRSLSDLRWSEFKESNKPFV